jgi:hypothetical protein
MLRLAPLEQYVHETLKLAGWVVQELVSFKL